MNNKPDTFPVDVALIHYPVNNRVGEIIGSAVTNLDLHDIARACRTYGVDTFYVITPYRDQQNLVQEILDHWLTGHGSKVNESRKQAISLVKLCDDLDGLFDEVREKRGCCPTILATSARLIKNTVSFKETAAKITKGEPLLLLFGTAWGLADEVLAQVDGVLPPIIGASKDYNHLSVRSAVSIILDRLLSRKI